MSYDRYHHHSIRVVDNVRIDPEARCRVRQKTEQEINAQCCAVALFVVIAGMGMFFWLASNL